MLRIKLQYDQEVSQEDFTVRSPTFFPKAPVVLKTCLKFLLFCVRRADGLFSGVSRCLPTVQSPDRWVGGMSSLEVLSILMFKSDLSQGTSVSLDLVCFCF